MIFRTSTVKQLELKWNFLNLQMLQVHASNINSSKKKNVSGFLEQFNYTSLAKVIFFLSNKSKIHTVKHKSNGILNSIVEKVGAYVVFTAHFLFLFLWNVTESSMGTHAPGSNLHEHL